MTERSSASFTRHIDGTPLRELAARIVEDDEMCATDIVLLKEVIRRRAELEAIELSMVLDSRVHGATWDEIGQVYGTTRQAAQQRFAKLHHVNLV